MKVDLKTFWTLLLTTPKASLMLPGVLLIQILKRVGICPAVLNEALVGDILDLLCAVGGMYGLYYALKADPNKGKNTPQLSGSEEKKP